MTIILPPIEYLLVYSFFSVLGIQLFYYLFFYIRIPFVRQHPEDKEQPKVSVIICAKNQEANLHKFLPAILSQNYPEYEVIVVNDGSLDDTETVLARFALQYPNLRHTTLVGDEKFKHGKKLALTVGIKAAKYETLLLTDADCAVESEKWISSMVCGLDEKHSIILGYGGYEERKGLLDKFIRYDTLFIAMNYLSFAHAGIPYMGVGRNLAYKKSLFWENNGFNSHYYLTSGDDDLFINEVANSRNTFVELRKESFTRSVPKESFKEWYYQKKRHSITGKMYKKKHKLLLGLEPLSRMLFVLLLILYFVLQVDFLYWYVVAGIAFKYLIQLIVVKLSMCRLNERKLLLYSPFIDVLLPFFYFILFFTKKNSYYYNREWN